MELDDEKLCEIEHGKTVEFSEPRELGEHTLCISTQDYTPYNYVKIPITFTDSKNIEISVKCETNKLKVSVGAGVVLGGIGGAAAGTLGGIAAGGATTAAVMTFGTASTGTAIATLSGAAATNATLAALGGGSIAAGGLGIGAGTMVLGGATLGVGLLVGGVIFNVTGCKLSEKADEAWAQMKKAEEQINKICNYLTELCRTAKSYYNSLKKVNNIYSNHLENMRKIVDEEHRVDWYEYNDEEQKMIENTTLLTQLLYSMCKVQLVLKTKDKNGINKVNSKEVIKSQQNANTVLRERGLAAITPQQYSGDMKAGVISLLPFTGANKDAVAYMINHEINSSRLWRIRTLH